MATAIPHPTRAALSGPLPGSPGFDVEAAALTEVNARIAAVIDREGGYSNNRADLGGPTCWGVTEQVARAYGYVGDMRELRRETAAGIYLRRYWLASRINGVARHYAALATELFDIGVNMGVGTAATFLQRALNALNQQATLYADVGVDGAIGALTLQALDAYRARRGADGGDVLLEAVRSLRGARYIEISEARPANETFTYGWFRRMVEMLKDRLR